MTERLSHLAIVNMALGLVGREPIPSGAQPGSKAERQALVYIETVRDALLEEHPWNFATVQLADLTESTTVPADGYAHAYELPADFIRLNEADSDLCQPWSIRGRTVVTNRKPTAIAYVRRETDDSRWPAQLKDIWAARLAEKIAHSVGSSEMRRILKSDKRDLAELLGRAKQLDGQASVRHTARRDPSWLTARNNWGTRRWHGRYDG